MGYSKTYIYNLTLTNLGVSATVQNTNQTDVKTVSLNNFYDVALESVLKDFDWNFANGFRELTPTIYPCIHPEYLYQFDYPNDCIAPRTVYNASEVQTAKLRNNQTGAKYYKFDVGITSNDQKVIFTNTSPALLRYTKLITKEVFFTSEFVIALARYLASLTAKSITGSSQEETKQLQIYLNLIASAKRMNAAESQHTDEETDTRTYVDDRN